MTSSINQSLNDDARRREEFPVLRDGVFLAHAGVSPLPRVARDALVEFADHASTKGQEDDAMWRRIAVARARAAELIGGHASEIALLGPTSLGLSLVANGWPWQLGDEVIYYADDYPANVYPWAALQARGVKPVPLKVEQLGEVTWEAVERTLTVRTRMVALASCHYLTGFRIDIDGIGRRLHERGIRFCLDAIQTLGAWPTPFEHVDFLSADSHKWMLGPVGAGIVAVKREHHDRLRPTLLGAWNVESPEFIAQDRIAYYEGARRYEPGALNFPGILAMDASLRLLLEVGIERVGERIRDLRVHLVKSLIDRGYALPDCMRHAPDRHQSGIVTVTRADADMREVARRLAEAGVRISCRAARDGTVYLRFSPHFYNTRDDLQRALAVLDAA